MGLLSFSPGFAFPLGLLLRMTGETINVNFTLSGEYVVMYRELQARGLVKGSKDAFSRGVCKLYDEMLERDLLRSRVSAARRLEG